MTKTEKTIPLRQYWSNQFKLDAIKRKRYGKRKPGSITEKTAAYLKNQGMN